MANKREPSLNYQWLVDPTPMPADIPSVPEIGATSAPLTSASYFIGARCLPYNDDFMLCKEAAKGRPADCLKEGRRVTRCAASVISDLNTHCAEAFTLHWQCLDNNNHQLFKCRKAELLLNNCVYKKLSLEKVIPQGEQVHLKEKPLYKPNVEDRPSLKAYEAAKKEGVL